MGDINKYELWRNMRNQREAGRGAQDDDMVPDLNEQQLEDFLAWAAKATNTSIQESRTRMERLVGEEPEAYKIILRQYLLVINAEGGEIDIAVE